MRNLVADLDGNLELNQNIESSIQNTINYYFNFKEDSSFSKRIKQEIFTVFKDKKSNRTLFFPDSNKLKPMGFNQIMNQMVKRLWEEENFSGQAKLPNNNYVDNASKDLTGAKISLDDAKAYSSSLKLLPFLTTDQNIFKINLQEQVKLASNYIKNGNNLQSLVEKFKILGLYVQIVYFSGKALLNLAEDYAKEPIQKAEVKPPITDDKIIDERATLLTSIIMSHPMTTQGYFKFSEAALKRSILISGGENLNPEANLKYFFEILNKGKMGQKVSDQQVASAAAKIMADFKKMAFGPKEKPEDSIEPAKGYRDFAMVIDMVLYELRNHLKGNFDNAKSTIFIKKLVDKISTFTHEFTEKHLTFILLYLKDPPKNERMSESEFLETLYQKGLKLKVAQEDIKYIYFLIQSEKSDFGTIPLSYFVAQVIREDNNSTLNEKQANQLKTLLGNLPKEVIVNHFYNVKEKLKSKVSQPEKILMVESITEYIHIKIADFRLKWAERKIQELPK
jgi:hypothetical protein